MSQKRQHKSYSAEFKQEAVALLAAKAYDVNALLEPCRLQQAEAVIPPKSNRVEQRDFNKHLHRHRYLVENAFLHLKRWRGIATRYAKRADSFLAAVQIRCVVLWANVL